MRMGLKILVIKFFFEKIDVYLVGRGGKIRKCHIKSKFQNYGRMVVDSLKSSSRRVEKEKI